MATNGATKPAQGRREGVFPMLLLVLFPNEQNWDEQVNSGTATFLGNSADPFTGIASVASHVQARESSTGCWSLLENI